MKNNHLVVYMPCYNRKHFVKEALNSVVSQDFQGMHLVVVDDHSNDGTYELLCSLNQQWDFTLLRTDQPRRGTYWIANMVMRQFPSAYYQVMDSDDIMMPGAISKLMNLMETEKAGIVGGQVDCINEDGEHLEEDIRWRPFNANFAFKIKNGAYVNHPGMIWKREVVDKIGLFNQTTRCTSDYEFLMNALSKNIVVRNLNDCIMKYRVHKNSLSNSIRFGEENPEMQANRDRIDTIFPPFYNVDYSLLGFFENELGVVEPRRRHKVEQWCLDFIIRLVSHKKIIKSQYIYDILSQINALEIESRDVVGLVDFAIGKPGVIRENSLEPSTFKECRWVYRIASTYQSLGEYIISKEMFNKLIFYCRADLEIFSGIYFHLGEIALGEGNTQEAVENFLKCLKINPGHIKAQSYLTEFYSV